MAVLVGMMGAAAGAEPEVPGGEQEAGGGVGGLGGVGRQWWRGQDLTGRSALTLAVVGKATADLTEVQPVARPATPRHAQGLPRRA